MMQNIFYKKKITKIFDLKGSLRGRFAAQIQNAKDDSYLDTPTHGSEASNVQRKQGSEHGLDGDFDSEVGSDREEGDFGTRKIPRTLLDGDFLEFTAGRPMPMNDRAKAVFHMSILNVSSQKRRGFFLNKFPTSLFSPGHSFPFHYKCSGLLNIGWDRRGKKGACGRHY